MSEKIASEQLAAENGVYLHGPRHQKEREPMTAEEAIKLIAAQAETTAFFAGVGAMEIAGAIISCMVNDPKFMRQFFENPGEAMLSDRFDARCNGTLSYYAQNGEIIHPERFAEARK